MDAAAGPALESSLRLVSYQPHRAKTDRLTSKLPEPGKLASDIGTCRSSRVSPATAMRYSSRPDGALA